MSAKLLALLVVVTVVSYAEADVDTRFIGIGYDMIKGNPDGDFEGPQSTGTDPGIKSLRRILSVSGDNDVESISRSSCVSTETIYENSEKYQEKLSLEINVEAGASYAGFSFSASAGFQQANEHTTESESVVYEKLELCKNGGVRYLVEHVDIHDFTVDDTFAAAVCDLPTSYDSNNPKPYMDFISLWGTHVITAAFLGTKVIERSETSRTSVLEFAEENYSAAISAEGSFAGFGGSLSVDVDYFRSEESFKSQFNSNKATYTIGTSDLPEPIQLTLHDIREVLEDKYWSHIDSLKSNGFCESNFNLANMRSQMNQALTQYPHYIETHPVNGDPVVIPLAWPEGTYGTVKMMYEPYCPADSWSSGNRKHKVNRDSSVTPEDYLVRLIAVPDARQGSDEYHFFWGYCMQLHPTGNYRRSWPKGSYCIFKKGNCPSGFQNAYIFIDDKGQYYANGYFPDGEYTDTSTKLEYCCRDDSFPVHPIYLPTERPFVLQPTTHNCQEVHGMNWKKLTVFIDGSGSTKSKSTLSPYDVLSGPDDHTMIFCHYTKA